MKIARGGEEKVKPSSRNGHSKARRREFVYLNFIASQKVEPFSFQNDVKCLLITHCFAYSCHLIFFLFSVDPYLSQVTSQRMQGLLLLIFAKYFHLPFLRGVQTETTRTGLGGYWVRRLLTPLCDQQCVMEASHLEALLHISAMSD